MRWMDLELIIQSEVRKRKTNIIYKCIYMESRRWYCQTYLQSSSGDADTENRLTDKGEGRKEKMRRMERITWKHIHYHR